MIFVIMLVGAVVSGAIANSKQRNVIGWGVLGALFPLISIIIVACLKPAPKELDVPRL